MTVIQSGSRTRGIPTTYRGTRFRSRLEARWAAFFDLIEWRWVYEPFDTEGWIPDFLISGPLSLLIEVGPVSTLSEFEAKASKPLTDLEHVTLVVGVSPIVLYEYLLGEQAGLLVNEFPEHSGAYPAFWMTCNECGGALRIFGDDINRPCGHTIGHHADGRPLFDRWAEAGNLVQWRSR